MQTSLARRQRRKRAAARRAAPRGGSILRRILIAIPIILVLLGTLVGASGALFTVAAYNYYAQGLPDPKEALTDLEFEQQTIVYDRTGKVELARLGTLKREVVTFDAIPGEMLDATTSIEDQNFWENPGFDPGAIVSAFLDTLEGRPRGASTITQQLVRARLLPEEAFEGSTYERKVREIIQSIRLTEAYPGDTGKQEIITAYLNQNFYGNNLYGVQAAAKGYFGKPMADLTLAEYAVLAAIPQSPTKFDLVKNAEEICLDEPAAGDAEAVECAKVGLEVPMETEIIVRRNYILELMKTRSTLTGDDHTDAEYEAAKDERLLLIPQVSATWRAPHFVWQVREELAAILCPETPLDCPEVDTGGYRVTTTLDWKMQQITERYVYAAARAPQASDAAATRAILKARKIPGADYGWILGLRGRNIHNAAAAVIDYRTGEVLAYVGSASYTAKGNEKFQPQYDVLADGWRQPGSAIKPIDYLIGIDDKTMTASTMFMDVVTDFGGGYTPTQADDLERGPVRLRSALQFSLNVPAIKATIMSGLEHVFERTGDFGLTYQSTAIPVNSMGIGTLEVHPIDLLGAYGTIANGGLRMPRQTITTIVDEDGRQVWPIGDAKPEGIQVVSPQSAYIVTDILAGNTIMDVNPYWGEWRIIDDSGKRRPAAYKTGTTNVNRDVHAYGYLAPAGQRRRAGPGRRGVDGQQQQRPQQGQPVAGLVGAALVGDHDRDLQGPGHPLVQAAQGPREGRGGRVHRAAARAVHDQDRDRVLPEGHRARPGGDLAHRPRDRLGVRAALAQRLRRPAGDARLLRPQRGRVQLPQVAAGQPQLGGPGGQGHRCARRAGGHPDLVLLHERVRPVRADLGGARSRPRTSVRWPRRRAASRARIRTRPMTTRPRHRSPAPRPTPVRARQRRRRRRWWRWRRRWRRRRRRRRRRSALTTGDGPGSRQNLTIVAPSPPSPRSPGRRSRTSGCAAAATRTASRRAPVPRPWMTVTWGMPARDASSR